MSNNQKYFSKNTERQVSQPISKKLDDALKSLNAVNIDILELVNTASFVYSNYTIQFARAFVKAKASETGTKLPSDELAKQTVLASEEMENVIKQYNDCKQRTELLIEVSRNLRKEIDGLKGGMFEDVGVNNQF